MGVQRVYLSVGPFRFEWNEFLPAPPPNFLTFLFDESELYKEEQGYTDEDPETHEETIETELLEIGFQTTSTKCKRAMESYGYNMPFLLEVYKFLRKGLRDGLLSIYREKANDREFYKLVSNIDALSPEEEVSSYISFMRLAVTTNFGEGVFKEKKKITYSFKGYKPKYISGTKYIRANRAPDFIDFDLLQSFLLEKCLKLPPFVLIISYLFNEVNIVEYPEVIWLMFLRLMIEIVPECSRIILNLNDLTEDEKTLDEFKFDSCTFLIEKINLYSKLCKVLIESQQDLWEVDAKTKTRLLASHLDTNELNNYDKGRALEDLVDVFFSSHPRFRVTSKRYVTGDEEIDLVIQNNVEKPFWIALQSPLLFFECKNWSKPVGSKELRDFEGKLRNHSNIAKIGIFLAYRGFTAECIDELKRMGREKQIIVLISREDIIAYINGALTFIEWLENLIIKFK
jgi:hypothetical protein